MSFEDLILKRNNLLLNTEANTNLNQTVRYIYDSSPDGSLVDVDLSKNNKIINGVVNIRSFAGNFFIKASGKDPNEVIAKLRLYAKKKLDRWKSTRFVEKIKKNIKRGARNENFIT